MKKKSPGATPLTAAELERLARFLGSLRNEQALTLEGLDGFFCALVVGPDLVMPSEYLPVVWGGELSDEDAFESEAAANALIGLMMRHWNAIIAELEEFGVYVPMFDAADERGVPGRRWARGFMRGVELRRRGWSDLFTDENEGQLMTIPLVAGEIDPGFPKDAVPAEMAEQLTSWMAAGAGRAYRHFTALRRSATQDAHDEKTYRRTDPKVGRNDPCPCGSGKKYKQCCGAAGSAVH
jgi:uncharacterized protein